MDHPEKQSTQKNKTQDEEKQNKQNKTQTKYEFLLEFEDTKGAIRIRISMKNRQHNGQQKYKKTNKTRPPFYSYIVKSDKSLGSDIGQKHT